MNKRKIARWNRTCELYEQAATVYRREWWLFRQQARWVNNSETQELVSELADYLNVPRPVCRVSYSTKPNDSLGEFNVYSSGIHRMLVRTVNAHQPKTVFWGVDNGCRVYRIHYYNVPAGRAISTVVLHEFAHYLCFLWWGHAPHDGIFCAVHEMLEDWWRRKKRKQGIKLRYRMFKTKGKD